MTQSSFSELDPMNLRLQRMFRNVNSIVGSLSYHSEKSYFERGVLTNSFIVLINLFSCMQTFIESQIHDIYNKCML